MKFNSEIHQSWSTIVILAVFDQIYRFLISLGQIWSLVVTSHFRCRGLLFLVGLLLFHMGTIDPFFFAKFELKNLSHLNNFKVFRNSVRRFGFHASDIL